MNYLKKAYRSLLYRTTRIYDAMFWKLDTYKFQNVDYFDFKRLCEFHKMPSYNPWQFNVGYGNSKAISRLLGRCIDEHNDYLEHGLWYTDNVSVLSFISQQHHIKRIYTYSEFRKEKIEKFLNKRNLHIPIITVGPYIRGANNFHTQEELRSIKKRLGKTLLVLPMHSYDGVDNNFDKDCFIQEIERIKPQFDTVLVCLAFKDVQRGNYQHFLDKGYTLVSNGCPSDPMFLARHRDLIELADLTMSNGVGTHVGYSISLGVPHYYYYQYISAKARNPSKWEIMELKEREAFALRLRDVFGKFQFNITSEQISFVKKYWGDFSY